MQKDYVEKAKLQEKQYNNAYHWNKSRRVEDYRYKKLTKMIFEVICDIVDDKDCFNIYDIGCGDGRSTYLLWKFLKNNGYTVKVIGIDIVAEAIDLAIEKMNQLEINEIDFIKADFNQLYRTIKGNNSKKIFIFREVIEHLPDEEITNILNKIKIDSNDNFVVITTPSDNSPVEPKHLRHYNKKKIFELVKNNKYELCMIAGFGFRPRILYKLLHFIKCRLNHTRYFWKLMIPFWQKSLLRWAVTIITVIKPKA